MTTNQTLAGKYLPIPSSHVNGMAFMNPDTGEILDFPESWRSNLDGVEHILTCNETGDYEEIQPIWPINFI
jgi:hypothetical protein